MNRNSLRHYDVAIVGAGPVGSVCALAHAHKGARVALLEANPKASKRLAGEWLHPPALQVLREVGIDLGNEFDHTLGKGFAVFPEDRSEPILLPYPTESYGMTCEHATLVSALHKAVEHEPGIDFFLPARVCMVEDGQLSFSQSGVAESLQADRIVGADGRASVVRKSLGLANKRRICSRMVGVEITGTELPFAGYGHVLLGGPGPILVYQLANQRIRIIIDVPLNHWIPRDRVKLLSESYAEFLPQSLRPGFIKALRSDKFYAATNELRLRTTNGVSRRVLIGDAAGNYHPMTAVGMTLGFGDAIDLAKAENFRKFISKRVLATRGPELLAIGLYEVFADHRLESTELRNSIYKYWLTGSKARDRTVKLLACEDPSVTHLSLAFTSIVGKTIGRQIPKSHHEFAWHRSYHIVRSILVRLTWLVRGILEQRLNAKADSKKNARIVKSLSRALLVSLAQTDSQPQPDRKKFDSPQVGEALNKAVTRLLKFQNTDGSWEGEMVWCPMLSAQYVLLHHIIGRPLEPRRQQLILHNFEKTQLASGLWGMHEHSGPHLFVTTLVYLAARLLGTQRDDPLIASAQQFILTEGVLNIPSWGKFWLALLNLYDWRGVHAILPELWCLPHRIALHPSNWYCHTRMIYMAMAVIYSHQHQAQVTDITTELRAELYPQGFENVKFSAARNSLRSEDLLFRPSMSLRFGYRLSRIYNWLHSDKLRARCVSDLTKRIRWELQTTDHTSISPVSGLLNILAIWLHDQNDLDLQQALAQLEGWIWEDERDGTRVTGARSASWDTGFILQSLAVVDRSKQLQTAMQRATDFLYRNQITSSFKGYRDAYRNDPKGGWCFAGGWHGWPVTDCTAEAMLGLIAERDAGVDTGVLSEGIQFILRGQNRDGGFGSYEARRTRLNLEWLNPSEMFGESMTEHSFVECTASSVAALAACRQHFPQIVDQAAQTAISRGAVWLRRTQLSDGSWRGVWGIQYIYGTLFGIRGLIATGAKPGDSALRLACQWLLEHQRDDGGWGEHYSGCRTGRYVAHSESQVIQTAWALIALLEAKDPDWHAISRGASHLLSTQQADGSWPKQDMTGVFFRTALLDYVLYRQYFPLHALGLYEQRCRARQSSYEPLVSTAVNLPDTAS